MRRAFKFTHIVPGIALAAGLLLPVAWWGMAHAAGLGRINVLSRYGQPFLAEIDLINVTRDELTTLNASLAPTSAYIANNLRFDPSLNSLRLSVERRDNGTHFVRASTTRRVNEPFVDLVVDLTWQGGKFQRHYSALLDLPSGPDAAAASAAVPPQASSTSPLLPVPPQVAVSKPALPAFAAEASPPSSAPPTGALPPLRALHASKPVAQNTPVTAPKAAAAGPQSAGPPASPQTPLKPETATTPAKPEATPAAQSKTETAKPADAAATATVPAATTAATAQGEPPSGDGKSEPKPETKAEARASAPVSPPAAKPAPVVVQPTKRGFFGTVLDYWWLVVFALFALGAALAGFLFLRRRDSEADQAESPAVSAMTAKADERPASTPSGGDLASMDTTARVSATTEAVPAKITVANSSDMVDPLDEAKVYVAYGQYEEAEKVLREALSKQRGREDVQTTLLEILAEQGDKEGFNKIAGDMHKRTGGRGENWKRVAAMGYALDPTHPLYPPTAEAAEAAEAARRAANAAIPAQTEVVEFDLTTPEGQAEALASTQVIPLQDNPEDLVLDDAKTMQLPRVGPETVPTVTARPTADFVIAFPQERPGEEATAVGTAAGPATATEDPGLDFKVDLPSFDAAPKSVPESARDANAPLEFKVEVPDAKPLAVAAVAIPEPQAVSDLPVINAPADPLPDTGGGHPNDEHWQDVQEKFDLVRAYREMGDEDGVREVLGEIVSEGDAGQQAEARKLLSELN